jgi:hypothetical protein
MGVSSCHLLSGVVLAASRETLDTRISIRPYRQEGVLDTYDSVFGRLVSYYQITLPVDFVIGSPHGTIISQ